MADKLDPIHETRTTPDPSNATLVNIESAIKSERDYVDGKINNVITRIDAMDEATKVLSDNVNRTPTLLQTAIRSFGQLMTEKFSTIDDKLAAAESLRLEQKADAKTGLDAALSAQKEAAGTQDINNQKAIDKSEKATAEIIKNNQDANKQALDTLTKGLDELKLEVSKITAAKQGGDDTLTVGRQQQGNNINATQAIIMVITLFAAVVAIFLSIAFHK